MPKARPTPEVLDALFVRGMLEVPMTPLRKPFEGVTGLRVCQPSTVTEGGLSTVLAQMEGGTYVAPNRLTLGTFLADEWLPSQENAIRTSTLASFKLMSRVYVSPRLGGTPLARVTPRGLTDFYKELQRTGSKCAAPLSPKSVRNVHGMLHLAFRDAMRWGRLARNPADLATLPRRHPRKMQTWTPEQLGTFLEHVREDRLYAAWLVLATTGLRRGELLGLRWEDVDFEESRLSIQRTWIVVDGRAQASEPKTAKGKRTVPLPAEAVAALHTHRRRLWRSAWHLTRLLGRGLGFLQRGRRSTSPGRILRCVRAAFEGGRAAEDPGP
jgi:integrase